MADPQPTVGRIVHYVSHGTPVQPDGSQAFTSQCRAAVVTAVEDPGGPYSNPEDATAPTCSLAVLNPTGMFFHEVVPEDQYDKAGGTWHWPERS